MSFLKNSIYTYAVIDSNYNFTCQRKIIIFRSLKIILIFYYINLKLKVLDEEKKIMLNDTAQISPKDEHLFNDIDIEDYRQKFNQKKNKKKVKKTSFILY